MVMLMIAGMRSSGVGLIEGVRTTHSRGRGFMNCSMMWSMQRLLVS